MKRFLGIFGVGVLLLIVNCEASVNSNRNFWNLPWGSDDYAPASGGDDLIFDNEGSGFDENDKAASGTHEDDEDFDGSGDEIIDLTTDDDEEDDDDVNEDDYYTNEEKDEDKLGTSDDEDLFDGSGSGDDFTVEEPIVPNKADNVNSKKPTTAAPKKQLTACENLQKSAKVAESSFVPECDDDGAFQRVQCMRDAGTDKKNCWCVDPSGIEITGTRMLHPKSPDCLYGENLSACVGSLVTSSQGLIGAFKPRCKDDGEYDSVQCHGSECWCVDSKGNEIVGTVTNKPNTPNCPSVTDTKVVEPGKPDKTVELPKPDDGYTVPGNTKEDIDNVIVNLPEIPEEESNIEYEEERTNKIGPYATIRHDEPILKQPGLLAAIIGGAVVGLLCTVLLVMFIVYRMRKKDEGSYPLDEQKYQNYSYTKAPDKEFYA